jgi:hypothetical protein
MKAPRTVATAKAFTPNIWFSILTQITWYVRAHAPDRKKSIKRIFFKLMILGFIFGTYFKN